MSPPINPIHPVFAEIMKIVSWVLEIHYKNPEEVERFLN
jgi:hypothetical protein